MARRLLLTASTIAIAIAVNDQRALAGGGPLGGQVVAGQASITSPNASSTLITQSTQKAVINWQSFSIAQGSSVQFAQPNASAIALNRVIGSTPSNINGSLFANGQVWLINGNGIIFGKGSQINVGSLIATTADMRDGDFMSGNYSFGMASANPNSSVNNHGTITVAKGGAAILAGASVSNDGLIRANMGQVTLASGSTFSVDFAGDNLLRFAVASPVTQAPKDANGNPKSALVSNSGTISAPGGQVTMTARAANDVVDNVINNTGMVEATSVSEKNGEIILDAGSGTAQAGGTLDASGTKSGETGGSVQILGNNVQVADGTNINVSGHSGGGSVLIGGDLHGGGTLPHAQNTTVGKAVITADATGSGNGGTVVAWSDGQTNFAASVSAKGGPDGGNGGQVETSGAHLHVDPAASVDTTAPKGATGNWLIDPDYIVIQSDQDTEYTDVPQNGVLALNTDHGQTDYIDPSSVTTALGTTDVTLEAKYEIDVYSALDYSSSHSLNLLSKGDVVVAADIQNAGTGAIMLVGGWDGTTTDPLQLMQANKYGNNGGSVFIMPDRDFDARDGFASEQGEVDDHNDQGNVAVGTAGGTTTVEGSDVFVEALGGYSQVGYHNGGGGAINVLATGDLVLDGGNNSGFFAMIGNGSRTDDVSGNVTGNISVSVAGTTTFNDGGVEGDVAWLGNFSDGGTESGNVTLITGDVSNSDGLGGSDTLGNMLVADLGTTDNPGSGGDVAFGLTNPSSFFLNGALGVRAIAYDSPHDLMLLSTGNIALPYSIQNDGSGALTILAGWNSTVAPSDVLSTQFAYGQNNAFVEIIGIDGRIGGSNNNNDNFGGFFVNSGAGVAIGSKGGTTTVGGAQVDILGVDGYAQVGYHGSGATGAIDVIANGTPGDGNASGAGACLNGSGNICVLGGLGTQDTNEPNPAYAQIGHLGQGVEGTASGAINVAATGNLSIVGGGNFLGSDLQTPNSYGQIGNGDASFVTDQTVSGDIFVHVGGQTYLANSQGVNSPAWIGNRTSNLASQSGNVTFITGRLDGGGDLGPMLVEDLGGLPGGAGGDVTVGTTANDIKIDKPVEYSSSHTFNILSTGNIAVENTVQNLGTGAINVVAGWNGTTLDPAHFTDTGVFGNGGGSILIGGGDAVGNSALGTAGGTMTVAASDVTLEADNGSAQLGYHGTGSGAIVVDALNGIALNGGTGLDYASIGNNGSTISNSGSGNVTLSANTVTDQNQNAIVADALTIDVSGNNSTIGAVVEPIDIWVNSLAVTGDGANAYFKSPAQGLSIGVGGTGINLGGGDLTITASGDINQTQSIAAHALAVTSTGGSITLTNGQNDVAGIVALAAIHGDAAFENSTAIALGTSTAQNLTLTALSGGISIGGTEQAFSGMTLSSAGDITEGSGNFTAIEAQTLVATSTSGGISLDNAGNAVTGTVQLSAHNDATFENASAITLGTSSANNLTLTALSGGVTLTGAVTATGDAQFNAPGDIAEGANGSLSAHNLTATSTGGAINLTAPNNVITGTVALSAAHDAAFANTFATTLGAVSGDHVAVSTTTGGIAVGTVHGATNVSLNAPGDVTEGVGGAITGGGLSATSTGGGLALGNSGNAVTGAVFLSAHNDTTFQNSVATTLGASSGSHVTVTTTSGGISVTGTVNGTANVALSAPGDITESGGGALTGGGLDAVSSNGGIALGNAANNVTGTVLLSAHNDATFENASAITLGVSDANNLSLTALSGGVTLTGAVTATGDAQFNAAGDIAEGANGSLSAHNLTATSTGGAINFTAPNNVVTGTVALSAAHDVAFANTVATTLGAVSGDHVAVSTTTGGIALNGNVHGATNVSLNAPGDVTEGVGGAITGGGLSATSTGGGLALGNSGNAVTGTVLLSAHNDATFENASTISLGTSSANNLTLTALSGGIALNGATTATGSATLTAAGDITEGANGTLSVPSLSATSTGGAVALTGSNTIGTAHLAAHTDGTLYDTTSVTLASFSVGGNATVLSKGSITAPASIQTPGNVTLVAGWDGTTTAPASLTNAGVFGNNSGNVTIGGAGASGNVAVGSPAGTTTVEGAGVQLAAVNGYAMIGGHGPATGSIVVNATGNVSLSGGAGTNDFAQIGNGGQGISGNDTGAITVSAGGDVILSGGAGNEAYAQIGQGGAETNAGSTGYTNDSTINVHATNATLTGGTGAGAYAQVGQGGFKAGENLAGGTATNSGDVSVVVTHAVALNGGGNDAYAQVGNGGDQSNMNAAASAHGLNTGNITVQAPNGKDGSVTLTAGNGTDAYADIGNGGFGANEHSQAIPANFVNSGNVSVTDLTLQGGNGGANAYAQIGNGGPQSFGNVTGNITIDANGNVVIIPGSAPGSNGSIGNFTSDGTISGSVTGFASPNDAALNGAVNTSTNGTNTPKNLTNTNDVYVPPNNETSNDIVYSAAFLSTNDKGDNAIETLSGGENDEETSSDTLTVTVANSLTKSKGSNSQTVIIGLLKQYTPLGSNTPHGVPPADQEYSSWGNEALWQ